MTLSVSGNLLGKAIVRVRERLCEGRKVLRLVLRNKNRQDITQSMNYKLIFVCVCSFASAYAMEFSATSGSGDVSAPSTIQNLLGDLSQKMGFAKPFKIEDVCLPRLVEALTKRRREDYDEECKSGENLLLFH